MRLRTRPLLAAATSAAALLLLAVPRAGAGCLAPADVPVDVSGTVGPLWGAGTGQYLYSRDFGSGPELVRRGLGEFADPIAKSGDRNSFLVGAEFETWIDFQSGAINDRGDAAFVASTSVPDDPGTIPDESIPRRGAYALRGNTKFEMGRHGGPSPVIDPFTGPIPWASFFDAVPLGRPDAGTLRAVYSAQLGGADGRQGLFLWDEFSAQSTPLVLTGNPSPAGGAYTIFGRVRCNESGDVVFYALTQVTPTSPIAPGLFRISRDALPPNAVSVTRIVKFGDAGDQAAGIGRFSLMQDFDVDGAGGVVFAAAVEDGPAAPSGLFRWDGGTFQTTQVLRQGDATPLGGTFGPFLQAQVRADEDGGATFLAPLSADVGGTGIFAVPAGSAVPVPLGAVEEPIGIASLGGGRVAYQTSAQTRTIVPADGTAEGPLDFRVALLDLRNAVPLRRDVLLTDLRFRLPPWGTDAGQAAPAVFLPSAERTSPAHRYAPGELARIVEVRLQVSQSPGQTFVFGIGGAPEQPAGSLTLNNVPGVVSKLSISKLADAATWKFTHDIGAGTFSVDLAKGQAKLKMTKGNVFGSLDPALFRIELTLRTDADVGAGRTGSAAYFHRSVRLNASQPNFGTGIRVLSKGESLSGGTFHVDALRVDRKLKAKKGTAAPVVTSDRVTLAATLRLCPGSTPPSTPTLAAHVTVGDLVVGDLPLRRVGKKGSKYSGKLVDGKTVSTLVVDAVKGTVSFRALNVPPLSQLADADFSGTSDANDSRSRVGGMTLPVSITIDRVYGATFDVGMTRLPGGKAFVR